MFISIAFSPFLPSLPPFFFFKIGSHHVAQANLEFTDPPASAFPWPGLKVCGIMSGRHTLPCGKKCMWKGSVKRHIPLTTEAGPLLTSDSSTWCCRDAAQWETCQLACLGHANALAGTSRHTQEQHFCGPDFLNKETQG